jgi:hypothetical protein
MSLQAQSLIGLFAIPLIAWALSERRGAHRAGAAGAHPASPASACRC